MQIERTGLILKTPLVQECIAFYRDILGCPIWFQNEGVTCLGIGETYILIEPPDVPDAPPPSPNLLLRINVANVVAEAEILHSKGAEAWVDHFEWGTICTFFDPAGTKLELMEAHKFRRESRPGSTSDASNPGPT